jgi:hypothetical protein
MDHSRIADSPHRRFRCSDRLGRKPYALVQSGVSFFNSNAPIILHASILFVKRSAIFSRTNQTKCICKARIHAKDWIPTWQAGLHCGSQSRRKARWQRFPFKHAMANEGSGEGKRQMGVNMTHRFFKHLPSKALGRKAATASPGWTRDSATPSQAAILVSSPR